MTDICSLERTLLDNLPWNKDRIKFVAQFLLALYAMQFEMHYAGLALFIVKLLGAAGPHTLALDRTNWKVGSVDLNILMLLIVYHGIGIPVVWTVLSKAGNSDTNERTTVIEIFLAGTSF